MSIPSRYKIWRYPLLLKIRYAIVSCFVKNPLRVKYWMNAKTFLWTITIPAYNWGDYINKTLAELMTGRVVVPETFDRGQSVAMVGSILPWAMDRNTIVWGSGCLDSSDKVWNSIEIPKRVCAVRGPLTRQVLLNHGVECPEVYGDPVMLFPRYYLPNVSKKRYSIGVVYHVGSVRQANDWISKNSAYDIICISPINFKDWREFIDKIAMCEMIVSSSLHGIIIANAYGVPNLWVSFSSDEHPDNNFKFRDYYLSMGCNISSPVPMESLNVDDIKRLLNNWVKPEVDLSALVTSCPFNIK